MRQVVLDTETTGMNKIGLHYEGHRIIEIGAVEIINRSLTGRNFHVYLNPERLIDPKSFSIHGISNNFLANKPIFLHIVDSFLGFIDGSELIIHNAPFDVGFINYELNMINNIIKKIEDCCVIVDSLELARKKFPTKRNSLDALCERYFINSNNRVLHNALLDAELLAHVFLRMTGGQRIISFVSKDCHIHKNINNINYRHSVIGLKKTLKIIYANEKELYSHKQILNRIYTDFGYCLWFD